MHDSFNKLLTTCGLNKCMSKQEPTYVELITEFNTSLDVYPKDSHILEFLMLGKKHQITYTFMNRVFDFKKDGMCDIPKSFLLWMNFGHF